MDHKTTGEWLLQSGVWIADEAQSGMQFERSAAGKAVSPRLTGDDIGQLMRTPRLPGDAKVQFPPEFHFSPYTGATLQAPPTAGQASAWLPPFGARPLNSSAMPGATGLRQTAVPMKLARSPARDESADALANADPDATMPAPPPGEHAFFSARFGTTGAALLALDARKGSLYGWLPGSQHWLALESSQGGLLSECLLGETAWRAELATGWNSRLYVPSGHGLACITPDLPSLTYQVEHFGDAPSAAAPVWFQGRLWAPLQGPDGVIRFLSLDAQHALGTQVLLDGAVSLGRVSAPVAYGRSVIWPCEHGQLRLQQRQDGGMAASWTPWPAGLQPQFDFGCPYLSRDGDLWQLCFDVVADRYLYLKLGTQGETVEAMEPRLCSGSFNYRFSTKLKTAPWLELERGNDGGSSKSVMPLLEAGETVLGVRFETRSSLDSVLRSEERMYAQLLQDDGVRELPFHAFSVAEPWRMRLFAHQGTLWAYHPLLTRIDGWKLQA